MIARYTVWVQRGKAAPIVLLDRGLWERAKEVADRAANEVGARVQVDGFAGHENVLTVRDWAAQFNLAPGSRGRLDEFWIVCTPSALSVLADVLCKVTPQGLALMVLGGLKPDAFTVWTNHDDAHDAALRLLAARGKDGSL